MNAEANLETRIRANLHGIHERMVRAALRAARVPEQVTLVAVTKSVGLPEVQALYQLGVRHFAENRPEACAERVSALPGDAVWHSIGNLQRRKVRTAVELFQRIDAVDRPELADSLSRVAGELGLRRDMLLEVNVSGEAQKHGTSPENFRSFLDQVSVLPNLRVLGIMTMAPFAAPESVLRKVFGGLRRLADEYALPVCSMGMTDDFEIAIEEGATEVRIGRALFE